MSGSWMPGDGDVVGGRYRLISQIGRGAMGTVFRAEHVSLGSAAAVKVIDPELIGRVKKEEREDLEHRFLREARAAAALNSAHVVRVLDYGIERGAPYIAMELLEGEPLASLTQRERVLSPSATFRILNEVGKAVARGHEAGIVHRDLKPENIFLARVDDDTVAKVLDFGIAKMAKSQVEPTQRTTRRGEIVGTPCYMSPEQLTGMPVETQADLWALGVIAFECLTGQLPFDADSIGSLALQICGDSRPVPSAIAPVPRGFDAWWARATKKNPAERFPNVQEAMSALRVALEAPASARGSLPESALHGTADRAELAETSRVDAVSAASMSPMHSTQATMSTALPPKVKSRLLGAGVAVALVGIGLSAWLVSRASSTPGAAGTSHEPAVSASALAPPAESSTQAAIVVAPTETVAPRASAIESAAPVPAASAPAIPPASPLPPHPSAHPAHTSRPIDPRLGF